MVDLVSEAWLQIAKGIVGQSSQMKNPIKTGEIISNDIARILADGRHLAQLAASQICTP